MSKLSLTIGMGTALLVGAMAGLATMRSMSPKAPARVAQASVPVGDVRAFKIDATHSNAMYRIKHQNVAFNYGRFNAISGSFLLHMDEPGKSVLDVTVQTDSVDTDNEARDKHLRSQDFFSSKEFPTMTFRGTGFKKVSDTTLEVTGDLSIHGQTKQVTVIVDHTGQGKGMRGGEVAGLETRFTIKRTDFGMDYMVGPIGEEVTIIVSLEGTRD